jgi:hypothetical protein
MARALELLKKYTGWAKLEASMEDDFQKKLRREIYESSQRSQKIENIVWEAIALEQAAEDPDMQDSSRRGMYREAMEKHRYFWNADRVDQIPTTAQDAAYKIEAMFLDLQYKHENELRETKYGALIFGTVIVAPILGSVIYALASLLPY